jgi:hypothetical protein
MSIPSVYGSSAEASKAGWFSRRHRTSEEHMNSNRQREARKQQQLIEANERRLAAEERKVAKVKA